MNYKSYKELNESSIEQWAKELDTCRKSPFSDEEMESFLILTMEESKAEQDKDNSFQSLLNGYNGVSLLYRRLTVHSYTMSRAALVFCGLLIQSPGEMVMMANYIQYKCHSLGIKHIDMKNLGMRILPFGWFDRSVLSQAWSNQKYVSENNSLLNMLDNPSYGLSIGLPNHYNK